MARRLVVFLAIVCLNAVVSVNGQTHTPIEYRLGSPPTIEQLLQSAEVFEQEAHLLQENPAGPVVLTVGDSITWFGYDPNGWATLLKQDFPHLSFMNKGVGMGNTFSGTIIAHQIVAEPRSPLYKQLHRLKLVTICFGANDASTNLRNTTWRAIPEANFKANLIKAINTFKEANVSNFLLLTPPPAAAPPRIDRRLDVTEAYGNIVKEIGQEMHIPVVDIFHAILAVPDWKTTAMVGDGLHLASAGQLVVHDAVRDAIRANYPELAQSQ